VQSTRSNPFGFDYAPRCRAAGERSLQRGIGAHYGWVVTRRAEHLRGLKEARTAIATLQERWPEGFAKKRELIRPLVSGVTAEIAAALGWSKPYTRAVIEVWKLRDGYCEAVLRDERRYDLTGAVTDQIVAERAREDARQQLARRRAAELRRQEKNRRKEEDARSNPVPDLITAPRCSRVG
jgi:sRNA-binding protein